MPSDQDIGAMAAELADMAAALGQALTDHPAAVVAVLAAVQSGPADTASIIARAAPVPEQQVLAALTALRDAGIITLTGPEGGQP